MTQVTRIGVVGAGVTGLVDLASAIRQKRPPRASGQLATHVLEVLLGLETSARERRAVTVRTRAERPAPGTD